MHPVGPRSSGVYWVRRLLVAVLALVVVIGVVWFVVQRAQGPGVDPASEDVTTTQSSQMTGVLASEVMSTHHSAKGKKAAGANKNKKKAGTKKSGKNSGASGETKAGDRKAAGEKPATTAVTRTATSTKAKTTKAKTTKAKTTKAKTTKAASTKGATTDSKSDATHQKKSGKKANGAKNGGATKTAATKATTKAASKSGTTNTAAKGTATTKPTATTSSSTAAPTTTAPPKPSYDDQGRLLCPDSAIEVRATSGAPSYPAGSQPILGMTVTNTGSEPCVRDLSGPLQVYTVYSKAGKRLWSTADCFPGQGTDIREIEPGQTVPYNIKWSGTTSTPGCSTPRTPVGPGSYTVIAALGKLSSKPHAFTITG